MFNKLLVTSLVILAGSLYAMDDTSKEELSPEYYLGKVDGARESKVRYVVDGPLATKNYWAARTLLQSLQQKYNTAMFKRTRSGDLMAVSVQEQETKRQEIVKKLSTKEYFVGIFPEIFKSLFNNNPRELHNFFNNTSVAPHHHFWIQLATDIFLTHLAQTPRPLFVVSEPMKKELKRYFPHYFVPKASL